MSSDSQDNRFGISSSVDKKTLKLQNKTDNTNSNIDTVETNKTRKISTNHSTKINLINPNGLMDNLSNTDIDKNICIKCKIAQPKTTKKKKKKTQNEIQKQKQQERTIIRVRIGTDEGDFKIKDLKKIDYFEAIMSKRWNSGCNQNNNIDCGGIDKRYSDCNSSNFNNDSSSWNSKLKENKDCVGQKRGKIDSVESLSSGVTTDPDKSAFGPKKAKRRKISQISNDMVDTIDTVDCNVITVFGEFVQDIAATTETTRPDYTDEGKNISGVRFDCDYTGTSEMTNGNCNKNENNNNCNSSRNSSNIRNSDSGYDDFQAKQQGLRTSIERLGISFNNGMLYPFGCQELRLIIKIIDTGKIPINFNASYDTFYRLLKCDDYFSLKLINKDLINDYLLNGIPGITPKTAENIINRYKTCQRLINKHKDLKKDGKTNQTTNNNRNKTKTDRNNCNSNYTTQSDDKIFCQHRRKEKSKSKSKLGTFSSVNACRHRSDDKGSVSSDNVNFGNANKHRTSNNPQPTRRQSGQQIRTSTNSVYNCKCRTDGEIELEIEDDDIGSNYSNYGDLTRSSQSSCACEEMKKDSDINIERRKEQELEQILIHTQARESDLKVMHDVYECVCIELERRKENLVSSQEFALKESQIACLRDNKKVEMLSLFPDITLAKLFGHKMTVLFETMQTQGPAPQYAINPTQQQNSPHGIPQQTMIYYRAHIPNCHESERLNLNQLWQKLRNKKLHSKYFDECFDNHFRDMIDAYLRIMDGNYHIQWMDPNIKYKNFQKILICVLTNLLNDFDNNIIDRLPCTRINIIKILFYLNINNPCSILNKEFCDKIKNYGSKLNKREYLLFLKCLIVGNERYVMRIKKYFVNNLSLMNDQSMKSISIYCDLMKYFLLKCNPSDVCKISSDWFSLLCNNSDKWIINKFVPKLTSKQRCDFATEIINYAMFRHKDGMQQLISKYKDFLVQELGLWAVESLGSM